MKAMVQCMDDSGSLTNDIPNALLDEEIKARSAFGVIIFPSIFISGVMLRDDVSPLTVRQELELNQASPSEVPSTERIRFGVVGISS